MQLLSSLIDIDVDQQCAHHVYEYVYVYLCAGSPLIQELRDNPRLKLHLLPELPLFVKGTRTANV